MTNFVKNNLGTKANDSNDVPLYEELKLGTKATEYESSSQFAAARKTQYQFVPSQSNEIEM